MEEALLKAGAAGFENRHLSGKLEAAAHREGHQWASSTGNTWDLTWGPLACRNGVLHSWGFIAQGKAKFAFTKRYSNAPK